MTPLRQQRSAALHRSGKGERTQPSSVRAVRLLSQFYDTSPDVISAPDLQDSFLYRKHVDRLATTMVSLPLTQNGHAEASQRLHALRQGLLPCPPSPRAWAPWLKHPWSAFPLCRSRPNRL
jgi:hypothetical protein